MDNVFISDLLSKVGADNVFISDLLSMVGVSPLCCFVACECQRVIVQ